MLKLIVTLKQAPKSNMVSMQEGTNIVVRNPEDAMLTFDDCNALELAMTLKDAMGDDVHITTLSFGNDKTEEILRESSGSRCRSGDSCKRRADERVGYPGHGAGSRRRGEKDRRL